MLNTLPQIMKNSRNVIISESRIALQNHRVCPAGGKQFKYQF